MHPPHFISSLPNCHVLISELPNNTRSVSQGEHHPKKKGTSLAGALLLSPPSRRTLDRTHSKTGLYQ